MRYLNADDTRRALDMPAAIEAMELAFGGDAETPLRTILDNVAVMPGKLGDVKAVKIISLASGNPGVVAVFDAEGLPIGFVDGAALTAIRTGAVSGLATKLLANDSASVLAMLGAGAMAFDQIDAVRAVRPIDRVLVWSRSMDNAQSLADRVGGQAVADPDEAVREADVISCATPATKPLFDEASIRAGAHVNAVGAFRPEMVELPADLLERAYVVVDDVDAAAAEAGDLIQAGRHPNTTVTELLAGTHPQIGEDVTVFKSVGVAAQDVAAGHRALVNAARMGLGIEL
jgi:ornithine cyclodeaminase